MKALLYKDISDAHDIIEVEAGKPLYEYFSKEQLENKIIIVNGQEKTPDYILELGDVIIIRSIPGAFTTGLLIVLGVAALVVAVYAGVKAYQTRKQVEELEDRLKNIGSDDITNIPYIKGASNSLATGKTQPYIIGKHLFTPYKLIGGYNTITGVYGENQYHHFVLEGGFNKQVLRKMYCDDILLKNWGDALTVPQEGTYAFDAGIFYDASNVIEIAQDGNNFATAEFNKKVVVQSPGDEIKKHDDADYETLFYTLEPNTMSADVCIMFNGLRAYNTNGDKISRTVNVDVYYRVKSTDGWTLFQFLQNGAPSNIFTANLAQQLRYNAHIDFTYSYIRNITEPIQIMIECITPKYDGSAIDSCYVQWIQSYIYNPDKSKAVGYFVAEKPLESEEMALSTMIGLKIKATLSNDEKLDKINIRTSGVARTWNGTAWSAAKVPTSNPASWLLEVLTSPTHLASQCDDTEIDLDSFGELYTYCETESLHCNMVITEGDTKEALLATILDTCNSALYHDIYGKISVVTDKVKENAIAILNTQNCISFSNKKEMARAVDGIRINYTNNGEDYESDSYLVMRDGVTRSSDSIIREMTVKGIEEYNHVVKYARKILAIDSLRQKTATASVGKEGVYYTPLGKVLVQHPSLKIGLGSAEIKSVITSGAYITGLELYEPIQYDHTIEDGFGVVIQAVDDDYCTPVSAAYVADTDGYVTEIDFVTPIALSATAIPHAGDILSYGYLNAGAFDTITSEMLITGIDPTDEGYTLTLVDYNEDIYTTGTIPEYTPNITTRKTAISVPAAIPTASKDELFGIVLPPGADGTSLYLATIYKQSESQPTAPSGGSLNFTTGVLTPPTGWLASAPDATPTPTYMATYIFMSDIIGATVDGGAWGTPVIFTAVGADGTSVVLKGSVTTYSALPTTGNTIGDVWIVIAANTTPPYAAGDGAAWSGTAWSNVGQIKGSKGDDGTTYYLYVRFSAYADGTAFSTSGNTYLGTCVTTSATAPTDKTAYTWVRAVGKDAYFKITDPTETSAMHDNGTYGEYGGHIYIWTALTSSTGYWTLIPPEKALGVSLGMYFSFDEPIDNADGSILVIDNTGQGNVGTARNCTVTTGRKGKALSMASAGSYIGIY